MSTRPTTAQATLTATAPDAAERSAKGRPGAPARRFLFDRSFDPPRDPPPGQDTAEELEPVRPLYDLGDEDPIVPGGEAAAQADPEAGDGDGEEAEAEPAPTFTAQDLEEARAAGHAAGRAEAFDEMAVAVERQAADALESMARILPEAIREVRQLTDTAVEQAAGVAAAITRKVLPVAADEIMLGELKALLARVLPDLLEEPRLVIRVHESLAEAVRGRLQPMVETAGFEGRLVVIGDTLTAPGDGRVEWAGGGVERRLERLWAQIDTALSEHLGAHPDLTVTPPPGPVLDRPEKADPAAPAEAASDPPPHPVPDPQEP